MIFSVTAIFYGFFLRNLLKIQKIHFFLPRIYIIIEAENRGRTPFLRSNSAGNVAGTPNDRTKTRNTRCSRRHYREMSGPGAAPAAQSEDTMVNKVRVNIAGAPYAIATTDSEKYILSLARKLDEDITKLMEDNANLSVTKAAVFCAMDYLDEYKKSAGSAENMRSQIQDYIADAARAKLAEDKVRAENETLRREAAALREQLARMRSRQQAVRQPADPEPDPKPEG